MINSKNSLFKLLAILVVMIGFATACSYEDILDLKDKHKNKTLVCFYNTHNQTWQIKKISKNSWEAYKDQGAVRLDDEDNDGFVPDNQCDFGHMGDCDDTNPDINPDVIDSCNTNIDSDGDNIPDSEDDCPNEVGQPEFNGCPDSDGDGIADQDDDCPTEAGLPDFNGCPDADGDGIPDTDDECPNEAGTVANNGCSEVVPD